MDKIDKLKLGKNEIEFAPDGEERIVLKDILPEDKKRAEMIKELFINN